MPRRFGQELVVRQVDHHGPDPRAIPHRAGEASGKGGPGLPATSPATATMSPMLHDHQGPGLGQIENLAGAMAGGHLRRQSRSLSIAHTTRIKMPAKYWAKMRN